MGVVLFTDPSSFRSSDLGTISGEFYLGIDDAFFPDEKWNDLVLPLANAWLRAVHDLVRGASWQERVRFMDGPFSADLAIKKDGSVAINLVESRLRGDVVRFSVDVDPALFLQNVVATATQILDECRSRGWSNTDIAELDRGLKDARRGLVGKSQ